ncbi:DUF4129 domain-containing protein [Microbacterium foliorum]|uniref:Protein-glutamine gamma-glutamyltransferase-like C-terminal domain-containing protein n=1 Tax=Microbacterium foliorum TaxID=104336 RepID=A0A0F0KFN2_9MICO|nr:DUF4129 domain-containing protein [Microbacterium foliorum]AXL11770.1 DUF4129 domain-containing protein [Microbacterium foliorum]KJL18101.1 hypothetical protein RN50_03208 [Microbacterium foliorum]
MTRLLDDVRVPDGDEARRWAEQELADPRYADAKPTWFDLMARDIGRFLADLFSADNGASVGPSALIIVSIIVFGALVAALIIWGRPRRSQSVRVARGGLLGAEDDRSAAQLRTDADRAARAQDWDEATILRFRALARGLLERDLIDPSPGATAQAIAREVSAVFPVESDPVRRAAVSFDDVRYLRHPATAERYAELAATDERLSSLRPDLVPA